MLTAQSEKELSGAWQRERERALKDSSSVAITGKYGRDDLHITIEGNGINDPNNYKISTNPLDTNTIPKSNKIDIRQRPEVGD